MKIIHKWRMNPSERAKGRGHVRIETLQSFLKILELGNFTLAAEELFITQSALSKQINDLEARMGQQLLERTTRSVKATEAGRVLRIRAMRIIEEWELLRRDMARLRQPAKPKLSIGYTTSEQLTFILSGLNRNECKKRKLEITMHRTDPSRIIAALREGQLDCAVMHRPTLSPSEGVRADLLASATINAFVPISNPLAARKALTMSDVIEETDVRCKHSRDPFYYDAMDLPFIQAGFKPIKRIEANESEELELIASQRGCINLRPSIYAPWKGFASIPVIDCKADFDFLFVRGESNKNVELDCLCAAIRSAMRGHS